MNIPIHLIMRFADKQVADTIAEHNRVIQKQGSVWIGKMGKKLGVAHLARIRNQRKDGIPTYLYLVKRVSGSYKVFESPIIHIATSLPSNGTRLIPSYYIESQIKQYMALWIQVSSITSVPNSVLQDLVIARSGQRLANSLPVSMAALFIAQRRKERETCLQSYEEDDYDSW